VNFSRLSPWILTLNIELDIGQGEPPCQMFRLAVILFKSYCPDRQSHPTECFAWTTKVKVKSAIFLRGKVGSYLPSVSHWHWTPWVYIPKVWRCMASVVPDMWLSSQLQSTAVWPIVISCPVEGRRLSWPKMVGKNMLQILQNSHETLRLIVNCCRATLQLVRQVACCSFVVIYDCSCCTVSKEL